ncbi:MAG: DUF6982 domain-containing protein [Acidobacteriaceae bacterium]
MMRHNVVVNLKNAQVLHGYYRADDASLDAAGMPADLPVSMTIEPDNGDPAVTFRLEEAKAVFFVRTFTGSPAQRDVRFFDSLSIHPYLWVRVTFQDGEIMEGRIANDINLLTKNAFQLFPVDELTNNRSLFVPKISLSSFQIIGLLEAQTSQLETA